MTDQAPIERAGNALMRNRAYQAGVAFGVPDETKAEAKHRSEIIKAVMDSIDTDELAQALANHSYEVAYGGCPCGADFEGEPTLEDERSAYDHHLALAVKNWLTGKDQQ